MQWRAGAAMAVALMALGCAHRGPAGASGPAAPAGAAPGPGAGQGATASDSSSSGPYGALGRSRAALPHLTARADSTVSGGVPTHWVAYFDRDSLRFIEEIIEQPLYGPRTNEYAFEGGRLRAFASSGQLSLTGPGSERGPYRLRIAFGPDGEVTATEKIVSGARVSIEEFEPPAALGRAAWLRAQIGARAPAGH